MTNISLPQIPKPTSKSDRASRGEIFAGMVLFLFLGLFLTFMDLPHEWGWIERSSALGSYIFALQVILSVTGCCVGWIKGFPRWSYPYVGVSLLISLYLMNASTPGISFFGYEIFGRELWGWRSWIPLLIATIVALIISRSLKPVKKFFSNGWKDWTLFTFGMFSWMPMFVLVGFDEIDNLYTIYFTIGLNAVMILSAYVYMGGTRIWQRALALGIGIVITVAVASLGSTLYWLGNGWVSIAGVIKASFSVVIVMFAPAFIGVLRYTDNPTPSEWES